MVHGDTNATVAGALAANARDADVSRSRVTSQTVSLTHRFSDSLSLRNGFRHYDYDLDRRNTLSGAVLPVTATRPRPLVSLNRSNFFRDEDGWSNQLELTHIVQLAGMRHTLLYGVEIARQQEHAAAHGARAHACGVRVPVRARARAQCSSAS